MRVARTNQGLLNFATNLIETEDARHWWDGIKDLLDHPRFTATLVPFTDERFPRFRQAMESLHIGPKTRWVHMHPHWEASFGVFIVREGSEIIYEGRDATKVREMIKNF